MTEKYEELKERYEKYAVQIETAYKEIEDNLNRLNSEAAQIQRKLSGGVAALTGKEYKSLSAEMDDIFEEIEFYENRKRILDKSTLISKEEYEQFKAELSEEAKRIAEEAEARLYEQLLPIVSTAEKYTTDLNEIASLLGSFAGAFAKRFNTFGFVYADNYLPDLLKKTNIALLSALNPKARQVGAEQTECVNSAELKQQRSEIFTIGQKLGYANIPEISITG